jgi:16S rRNA C1402 N4-methylase RsmH
MLASRWAFIKCSRLSGIMLDMSVSWTSLTRHLRGFSYHKMHDLICRMDDSSLVCIWTYCENLLLLRSSYPDTANQIIHKIWDLSGEERLHQTTKNWQRIAHRLFYGGKTHGRWIKRQHQKQYWAIRICLNDGVRLLKNNLISAENTPSLYVLLWSGSAVVSFHSLRRLSDSQKLLERARVNQDRWKTTLSILIGSYWQSPDCVALVTAT